jgi:hypothetical protein
VGLLALLFILVNGASLQSPPISLEYQVKAGYLFNFIKFVEWPAASPTGVRHICVAGRNPFGDFLMEMLRGETVNNSKLVSRVITMPEADCDVIFVPDGVSTLPYLRAARGMPTLTVGESPEFITEGGIVNFVLEDGKIRFQISPGAADRAELRISSHLLRLARIKGR